MPPPLSYPLVRTSAKGRGILMGSHGSDYPIPTPRSPHMDIAKILFTLVIVIGLIFAWVVLILIYDLFVGLMKIIGRIIT